MLTTSRRGLLRAGGVAALLATVGGGSVLAQDKRMRFLWWGSQERADRTNAALAAYRQTAPGVDIVGEFTGWSDYWPRLATQVAGRNAPDLIQMDYRYIFEYARRGALMPFDDDLGKALRIDDFGQQNIDSGRVDGKLYGINLGVNSVTMGFDAKAWEKAGVDAPEPGITWDEFADRAARMSANKPKPNFYASADAGGVEPAFEGWLQQDGKNLYTDDGKLGYAVGDATNWFAFWDRMRKSGACVPADVQALDQLTIETNALTTGKAATAFFHSNQFIGYQALNKAELSLGPYPTRSPDAPSGHYLKPSMLISVSSGAADKEAAVAFCNFLVEDPAAAKALGIERGVPASAKIRDAVATSLDATATKIVDYIGAITPRAIPLPPPPPTGAGELQFVLKRINEEVGFGQKTPEQAGEDMVKQAQDVLARG
ncbi:ABC transporter substrate-binding protein [Mangrovibrevibacter kandeliae]|uniref:ABC transporter substrate-binding protein n=1 Tax=Mangrovibrevibacter kandeliae TaxID=2968473 RepID=UPI002118C71E|nr:ABC transporter substrate-binding protein [Aurantimonas sp. CSK15Z-1]MCQ8783474.1 ABC transporter substrate-binding protein [Aurantimonas sp. CSK15Z-1]